MAQHEAFIRQAIALADSAVVNGNHPFGALLVRNDEVLLTAENTVVTENNPTQHAEMNLVNLAWKSLPKEVIQDSVLYTSCEPCPMCTGAIFWSGIRSIVFSLRATVLGEIANDKFCCSCNELLDRADDKTNVIGPILEEESAEAHKRFW